MKAKRSWIAALSVLGAAACSSSSNSESYPPGLGPGSTIDGGADATSGRDGASPSGDGGDEPAVCTTERDPGTRSVACEGLKVSVHVPASCPPAGCGLVLDLHGALMSGDLEDSHTNLRALAGAKGFVVVQPTAPTRSFSGFTGPQWFNTDDEALHRLVLALVRDLGIDRSRVHATGFSQGGFAVMRLLCKYAGTFASVAPGAAGSNGCPLDASVIASCTMKGSDKPAREIDVLFLYGRKDAIVPESCAKSLATAIVQGYGLGTTPEVVAEDASYAHKRYTKSGAGAVTLETLEHDYEAGGSLSFNAGHCVPGSKANIGSSWDDLACTGTNAFVWGEEVTKFFVAHPGP